MTVDTNVWVAAFDRHDRFHAASVEALTTLARREFALNAPVLVVLEVACAVSRRANSMTAGRSAAHRLTAHPTLTLHPLDDQLLALARDIGTADMLRAANALYAAMAQLHATPLLTWDSELISRSRAIPPDRWLAENG